MDSTADRPARHFDARWIDNLIFMDATEQPTEQPIPGINPLLSLRKHYRLALLVAVFVFMVGLPVAWIKGASQYTAESVFQVAPMFMKNLKSDPELEFQSNSQYRQYVNQLSVSVTRYDVIERALARLKKAGIDLRPPALSERKFIERLQKMIYVRPIPDTYMVRVGIESDRKEHLADLVNAVMQTFVETAKSEQLFGTIERIDALQANSSRLRQEISRFESERVALAGPLGLTTFSDTTQSPYDALLVQGREKLASVSLERSQAQAALAAFLSQREVPSSLGRSLLEIRLQDNGLQALRNEVIKRTEELNRIMAGLEEQHPARQSAAAELAQITRQLENREADFDKSSFDNQRRRLLATLQQKQQVEAEGRAMLEKLEAQASAFARAFQQAMSLTGEIKRRDKELQDIRERLSFLTIESDAIGFVRIVTPAMPAETPMGVGRLKLLLAVIVAAGALGLATPLAIDMLNRQVRQIQDAENAMGIPAAGWQPAVEDATSALFAEEQMRRFVSTLIRNRARTGRQIFAFTAVGSVASATHVVLDAARVIRHLGPRVLVVDANSYGSFEYFETAQPGLSDFLSGQAEAASLVHSYSYKEQTLEVVVLGSQRAGGLQRLDLLRQITDTWAASYDFVLFDLPPILLSADTEFLVEILKQVFVVVEAEAATKGEVGHAKRLLQRLDPDAVGLFVNQIRLQRGGSDLQKRVVETIAGEPLQIVKRHSALAWQVELLKSRLVRYWYDLRSNRRK